MKRGCRRINSRCGDWRCQWSIILFDSTRVWKGGVEAVLGTETRHAGLFLAVWTKLYHNHKTCSEPLISWVYPHLLFFCFLSKFDATLYKDNGIFWPRDTQAVTPPCTVLERSTFTPDHENTHPLPLVVSGSCRRPKYIRGIDPPLDVKVLP